MELSKKLQLPPDTPVLLIHAPKDLDVKVAKKFAPGVAVLVFARDSNTLATNDVKPAIDAAKVDQLSWIAYPKSGQLGTDLNRDKLVELMRPYGIEGVRLVSVDDVWSAMRFRPKKP
jgi:hypothetical protein